MPWLIMFLFLVLITTLMIYGDIVERKKNTLEEEYYEKLYLDRCICKYCGKTLRIGPVKCAYCFAPVKED